MKRLRTVFTTLVVFMMVGFLHVGAASGYTIDGYLLDWGIDLSVAAAANVGYLDSNVPLGGSNLKYITEDNADLDNNNDGNPDTSSDPYKFVGPGYSIGNKYDVEAIYFDHDGTYGYLAIVSGLPKSDTYEPGDISIDVGRDGIYELAIDVPTTGYDSSNIVSTNLYSVSVWDNVIFGSHFAANPWRINTGTILGTAFNLAYSSDQNSHYVIETSFPLAYLGLNSGDTMNFHWTMECGNDFLVLDPEYNNVPEPATLLLLGTCLMSLAGVRRKRGQNQRFYKYYYQNQDKEK